MNGFRRYRDARLGATCAPCQGGTIRGLAVLTSLVLALAPSVGQAQSGHPNAVTTRHLARLRDIGGSRAGLSVSPSGRSVLFNLRQGDPERNTYQNQWVLLDVVTKAQRVLIADAGTPLLSYGDDLPPVDDYNQGIQVFTPLWSPDEQRVFFVRRDESGIRLYEADVNTARSLPVELPAGKVTALKADGHSAALVTLEVPAADAGEVTKHQRIEGVLFTGNEFAPVLGIPTFPAPTDVRTLRVDLRTGVASASAAGAAPDACEPFPGWPRDQDLSTMYLDCAVDPTGRAVAVGLALGVARQGAALYTASNRKATALTPAYDWLSAPVWSLGTAYYVAGNGYATSNIYAMDVRGRVRQVTRSQYLLTNCEFKFVPAAAAVCTAETFASPREVARVDLRNGRIELLTNLNPEYNARERPRTVEIDWRTPAGDLLLGTLTYPLGYDSTHRYPVVVTSYPHRGFTRGSNGDEFPIPVFAAHDFLVLDVSAPASQYWTAFDITYDTFVRGYASPLRAVEQYLHKLAADGVADLEHVGICGLSGGANFAAYAVSHSRLFRAAIFDWHESDYLATITLGRERTRQLYARRGLGPADTANWNDYSLDRRAALVNASVLMNVADREVYFALGSYNALKAHGKAIEMWVYPDAHHVKWQPGQRLAIYERNLDWFNFWLRDARDPDLTKTSQYQRWRALGTQ